MFRPDADPSMIFRERLSSQLDDAFLDYAFRAALGTSLEEVTASAEFCDRAAYYRGVQNERAAISDKQAIALQAGVHRASEAISFKWRERDALHMLEHVSTVETSESPEELAAIEQLGRRLIERARGMMTPEMHALAERFRSTAQTEERLDCLGRLFEIIEDERRYEFRRANPLPKNEFGQPLYSPENAFPSSFEGWPQNPTALNCFGMSIILTAFAEETGAPYMYVNQLRNNTNYIWRQQGMTIRLLKRLLEERGIPLQGPMYDFITEDTKKADSVDMTLQDFHHSVAIKVSDTGHDDGYENWYQFDPYMHTYAAFDKRWEMDAAHEQLALYGEVLPGITITRADSLLHSHFSLYREQLLRANEISEAMQHWLDIHGKPQTFGELTALIDQFTTSVLPAITHDSNLTKALLDYFANEEFWMNGAFGTPVRVPLPEDPEKTYPALYIFQDDAPFERFNTDAGFRDRAIEYMVLEPLRFIMRANNYALSQYNEEVSPTPDPAQELCKPDFMIGLLMLNHLRVWSDYGTKYDSSRLVDYTSSQIFWHEALQDPRPEITPAMLCMSALLSYRRAVRETALHDRCVLQLALRPFLAEEFDGPRRRIKRPAASPGGDAQDPRPAPSGSDGRADQGDPSGARAGLGAVQDGLPARP